MTTIKSGSAQDYLHDRLRNEAIRGFCGETLAAVLAGIRDLVS